MEQGRGRGGLTQPRSTSSGKFFYRTDQPPEGVSPQRQRAEGLWYGPAWEQPITIPNKTGCGSLSD